MCLQEVDISFPSFFAPMMGVEVALHFEYNMETLQKSPHYFVSF